MGVRGLTTFINSNPHLFTKLQLSNSCLVIDGNGLCHKLYHEFYLEPFLGGDYEVFRTKLLVFFSSLAKCRLKLHVIFDGAFDVDDRKLETTLSRAKSRLNVVRKARKGVFSRIQLLPILALDVLRDVLNELGIEHTQCSFEADEQIAILANQLQCPVLSQDSDFYIFPLTHGYIQLDSLEPNPTLKKNPDGSYYLSVKIFFQENLLKCFNGLHPKALILLAVVLGNDFMCKFNFDNFFSNIRLPKRNQNNLSRIGSASGAKIIGFLEWLQEKTIDEAIQKVVGYVKAVNRESLEKIIRKNIENYMLNSRSLDENSLASVDSVPDWFWIRSKTAQIPAGFFLNLIFRRRLFFQAQIEDWTQPDSYICSKPIRQIAYWILFQSEEVAITEYGQNRGSINHEQVFPERFHLGTLEFKNPDIPESQNNTKSSKFHCAVKNGHSISESEFNENMDIYGDDNSKAKPKSDSKLSEFKIGNVEISLKTLSSMTNECRECLILNILRVKHAEVLKNRFPGEIRLFISVLVYWIKCPQLKMSFTYLRALIFSSLSVFSVFYLKRRSANRKSIDNDPSQLSELLRGMWESKEEQKAIAGNLRKYKVEPKINFARSPNIAALHAFATFQTCLLFSSYLNRLLFMALDHFQVAAFLNGTHLYNVYEEFVAKTDLDAHLKATLNEKQPHFYQALTLVEDFVINTEECRDLLETDDVRSKRRRNKRSKKKTKRNKEDECDTENDQEDEKNEITCEVSNRYDVLFS